MSVEHAHCRIHDAQEPLTCPTCGASGSQLSPIDTEEWRRLTVGAPRTILTSEQEESARQARALVAAGHVFYTCRCASVRIARGLS